MSRARRSNREQETRREARLGFLILALGILGVIGILFDAHRRLRPGFTVHVDLQTIGGMQIDAPVQISGRKIGEIRSIKLAAGKGEPPLTARARVDVFLYRESAWLVRTTSTPFVGRQGLLGQAYLEIGPTRDPGRPIQAGHALRGLDPAQLDELLVQIYRSIMLGSQLIREEEPTIREMIGALRSLDTTSTAIAPAGTLRRLFQQGRTTFDETRRLQEIVRTGTDDFEAFSRISPHLSRIASQSSPLKVRYGALESALTSLEQLRDIFDSERRERLSRVADSIQEAWKAALAIGEDLRHVASRIERGEVSIGKFLRDRELVDEIKETHRLLKSQPFRALRRPPR